MKGLEETLEDKKEERRWTAAQLAMTGLMAAVLCILGPISLPLPFSPVPISLGTLAVYLAAVILGGRLGTVSCALYLLLGLAGLPVFSGYAGGAAKLFGPTGGYLTGYLFLAMVGRHELLSGSLGGRSAVYTGRSFENGSCTFAWRKRQDGSGTGRYAAFCA